MSDVVCEIKSGVGLITLNRPRALNALSLSMVRDLTACLLAWRDHTEVLAVAHHVTRASAGHGALREFCDVLLMAKGDYARQLRIWSQV